MPPRIPSSLVNTLRRTVPDYFPDTMTAYRTNDSTGNLDAVYSSEPCFISPDVSPNAPKQATEFATMPIMYKMQTRSTVFLKEGDQVLHGTTYYRVREVLSDNTPLVFRTFRMERIRPATS